jgi:hypothetical protein
VDPKGQACPHFKAKKKTEVETADAGHAWLSNTSETENHHSSLFFIRFSAALVTLFFFSSSSSFRLVHWFLDCIHTHSSMLWYLSQTRSETIRPWWAIAHAWLCWFCNKGRSNPEMVSDWIIENYWLNATRVIRIGETDSSAIRNCFAKSLDLWSSRRWCCSSQHFILSL